MNIKAHLHSKLMFCKMNIFLIQPESQNILVLANFSTTI